MKVNKNSGVILIAVLAVFIITLFLVLGILWNGKEANSDTEKAVRSVSSLYLNEMARRRADVVFASLNNNLEKMQVAIELLTEDDLTSIEKLQAYQAKMKQLYGLEKFAFVDSDGLIYTSLGLRTDIEYYPFDYKNLKTPKICVKNLYREDKKVIIAVPVDNLKLKDKTLVVCFIEMAMEKMLNAISLQTDNHNTTFCNIYTNKGIALTNMVLGGLAKEDNLLTAMKMAKYEPNYSYEYFLDTFSKEKNGVVSFIYNDIKETLYYEHIKDTDWMLTYLIRESVIKNQISNIYDSILKKSLIHSFITLIFLVIVFSYIVNQIKKTTKITLEKEKIETENRIKHEELEQRISLQEKLLEQEKLKTQQNFMIYALSSDYRAVYFVDLDEDETICYRSDVKYENKIADGDHFPYLHKIVDYANSHVASEYRDAFLGFVNPENIRKKLHNEPIISYRYLATHDGIESYEMIKMARVRHFDDKDNPAVKYVGIGFSDIDSEMRESMQKNQALSDALKVAEEASKSKTAFLSNMSHEIRTPMNAIIGLDSIALHDPDISEKTRGYLDKIGGSAQHLLSLINDILDMSRIESGRMVVKNEEFSFPKLIEQINTIFDGQCQEKGIEYNCHLKGQIDDYYFGDNIKIRQILINILGNAVKFTPKSGRIDFTIEKTACFDGKSSFKFIIKDTGIGMSKEFLPKLFDTFTQEDSSVINKYGSSGLGMAITKNIVKMLNGNIEVSSEKWQGTTFTVSITLLDSERKNFNENNMNFRLQDLKILLVDDDSLECENDKMLLEKAGLNVEFSTSGKEAIEKVKINNARRDSYNLIVVDWQMPEMDGLETVRQIRNVIGDSAIIILSAYHWDDIFEEAIEAGVDNFISKPLFVSNLLDEFKEALNKKNLKDQKNKKMVDLRGKRVLLAEDMPINSEIMIMVLKMAEIEVDVADNGKKAVEMFASKPESYYDAILMDMRMPEMNGLEATAKIRAMEREDSKKIPIIALTANAFDEDVQRSLQAGLNAHISKPVQPDILIDVLQNMISENS